MTSTFLNAQKNRVCLFFFLIWRIDYSCSLNFIMSQKHYGRRWQSQTNKNETNKRLKAVIHLSISIPFFRFHWLLWPDFFFSWYFVSMEKLLLKRIALWNWIKYRFSLFVIGLYFSTKSHQLHKDIRNNGKHIAAIISSFVEVLYINALILQEFWS